MTDLYINVPSPDLRGKLKGKKTSAEVTYSVSYTYNGGIIINGEWYAGYKVGEPVIDKDCELVNICVGLELNARPPRATMVLRRTS